MRVSARQRLAVALGASRSVRRACLGRRAGEKRRVPRPDDESFNPALINPCGEASNPIDPAEVPVAAVALPHPSRLSLSWMPAPRVAAALWRPSRVRLLSTCRAVDVSLCACACVRGLLWRRWCVDARAASEQADPPSVPAKGREHYTQGSRDYWRRRLAQVQEAAEAALRHDLLRAHRAASRRVPRLHVLAPLILEPLSPSLDHASPTAASGSPVLSRRPSRPAPLAAPTSRRCQRHSTASRTCTTARPPSGCSTAASSSSALSR